jgi:hypothetical protein
MAFLLAGAFMAGSASSAVVYNVYNYFTTDTPTPIPSPNIEESVLVSSSPAKVTAPTTALATDSPDLFDNELRTALAKRRAKIMPGN